MRRVLTLSGLGELGPHLLDALEDHVAVAVEGLDAAKKTPVVSAIDQNLQREKGADLRTDIWQDIYA